MRVDVCKDEVDTILCGFFARAVQAYKLNIVTRAFVLAPLGIAMELQINTLFNEGGRPASAGAKVNEGVGCEGGAKEGAERGGKDRGSGGRLDQGELKCPKLGQGGLDAEAEEGRKPAI